MTALEAVRDARAAHGRSLRFDEYLQLVLYGEHGFYSTSGSAGRRGDFITSPEVGPLFGAVMARWIDAEHERRGHPDDFPVVECGAGPGTLARSILVAARSEERRVGKECTVRRRSRWSPYHEKKNAEASPPPS